MDSQQTMQIVTKLVPGPDGQLMEVQVYVPVEASTSTAPVVPSPSTNSTTVKKTSKKKKPCRIDDSECHQCPHCPRTFKRLGYLQLHLTAINEKKLTCEDCGKKFAEKGHLALHKKTHQMKEQSRKTREGRRIAKQKKKKACANPTIPQTPLVQKSSNTITVPEPFLVTPSTSIADVYSNNHTVSPPVSTSPLLPPSPADSLPNDNAVFPSTSITDISFHNQSITTPVMPSFPVPPSPADSLLNDNAVFPSTSITDITFYNQATTTPVIPSFPVPPSPADSLSNADPTIVAFFEHANNICDQSPEFLAMIQSLTPTESPTEIPPPADNPQINQELGNWTPDDFETDLLDDN